jgi:hypothetical protein
MLPGIGFQDPASDWMYNTTDLHNCIIFLPGPIALLYLWDYWKRFPCGDSDLCRPRGHFTVPVPVPVAVVCTLVAVVMAIGANDDTRADMSRVVFLPIGS